MDSDDEFDVTVSRGGLKRVELDIQELLTTKTASFSIEDNGLVATVDSDEEDDDELKAAWKLKKKRPHAGYSYEELRQQMYEDYSQQDFSKFHRKEEQLKTKRGATYAEIAKFMDNVTPDGGIKKRVIVPGWGGKVQKGQIVYVDYIMKYEKMDETARVEIISDATKVPEREAAPYRFKVGAGNVIPVLDIGVETMQLNESAEFVATHEYAFREHGLYGEIPPRSTIMVELILKRIEDGSVKQNVWDMDRDERFKLSFKEKISAVNELKAYGNDFYISKDIPKARSYYKKALNLLQEILTPCQDEVNEITNMLYLLYINIGQCRIMEKEYHKAKGFLREAIKLDIPHVKKLKAYYRLALCQCELGETSEARRNADIAKGIDASNPDVDNLYMRLKKKVRADFEHEKQYAKKMFKDGSETEGTDRSEEGSTTKKN